MYIRMNVSCFWVDFTTQDLQLGGLLSFKPKISPGFFGFLLASIGGGANQQWLVHLTVPRRHSLVGRVGHAQSRS